ECHRVWHDRYRAVGQAWNGLDTIVACLGILLRAHICRHGMTPGPKMCLHDMTPSCRASA
ncbi:hypothetical protein HAX54_007610, partial [Datura stramonium]|nr:hypothetical protein [Datura stramonium]